MPNETPREIRATQALEIRADEAAEGVKIEGYAAVFNERASIGGYFEEVIAPGAFAEVLSGDTPLLVNHTGLPLARTRSGTLALTEDARGLHIATELSPEDPDAQKVIAKMKRGDLDKMSFAFSVATEEWDETGDVPLRTIKKIKRLYDVAIVTEPAYSGTDVGLRSLEAHRAACDAGPRDLQLARRGSLELRLRLVD